MSGSGHYKLVFDKYFFTRFVKVYERISFRVVWHCRTVNGLRLRPNFQLKREPHHTANDKTRSVDSNDFKVVFVRHGFVGFSDDPNLTGFRDAKKKRFYLKKKREKLTVFTLKYVRFSKQQLNKRANPFKLFLSIPPHDPSAGLRTNLTGAYAGS